MSDTAYNIAHLAIIGMSRTCKTCKREWRPEQEDIEFKIEGEALSFGTGATLNSSTYCPKCGTKHHIGIEYEVFVDVYNNMDLKRKEQI